ncbi:MAG: sugar ABC transporter ATP-binding protein [Myxococcota bacterium]
MELDRRDDVTEPGAMNAAAESYRLELRHVSKSFGATRALRGVSLGFRAGEVHVIAGGNGAGKSTLIKIVSGAYSDYAGELLLDGEVVRFADPTAARRAGIATIYQELSLVPSLSIADNLALSRAGAAFAMVSPADERQHALDVLRRVGLELDPNTKVERLSLSERQLIEIGRAVAENARVLVMDEPTSALSQPEVERLFDTVRELLVAQVSIIYISHRRDEVRRLAQHVSVLRDGELVLSSAAHALSEEQLVHAMLGESVTAASRAASLPPRSERSAAVRLRGISARGAGKLRDVTLEAARGEILGLAGLNGSGASLVLSVLAADTRVLGGEMELLSARYQPKDSRGALKAGVAFLPADRGLSVFSQLSVVWNSTLSGLSRFTRWGWVERRSERTAFEAQASRTRLKSPGLVAPAAALSGGNQQKLALMRCLLAEPRVLLLDDPTRGVDARAKADIAQILRDLASQGLCVMLLSSELEELVAVCDRVLVFFDGCISSELTGDKLRRDNVLSAMMGTA